MSFGMEIGMVRFLYKSIRTQRIAALLVLFSVCVLLPVAAHADKKKKKKAEPAAPVAAPRKFNFDPTKLVQSNREGRKRMKAYFRQRGVIVRFSD